MDEELRELEELELYRDYKEYLKFVDLDENFLDELCDRKRYKPVTECGFVFFPSYRKTYWTLKSYDPDLALLFLEALIAYGTCGTMPDLSEQPVVQALMYGPMKTMDKAFVNYLDKRNKIRREHKKLEEKAALKVQEQERLKQEAARIVEEQEHLEAEPVEGETI